jgi:hypothetical protein
MYNTAYEELLTSSSWAVSFSGRQPRLESVALLTMLRMRRMFAIMLLTSLMVLVLGCGGMAAALHQGLLMPLAFDARVGPLHIVTHAPRAIQCPQSTNWSARECAHYQADFTAAPRNYRVWVFVNQQQHGQPAARLLMQLQLPLRASS